MYIYRSLEAWNNCHNIGDAFLDEQLYILGVKREYFYCLQEAINSRRKKKKELIKEYLKNPENESFREKIMSESINIQSEMSLLYFVYRDSLKLLRNPKENRKRTMYWWMSRKNLFDTLELQKYKLLPDIHIENKIPAPVLQNSRVAHKNFKIDLFPEEWDIRY